MVQFNGQRSVNVSGIDECFITAVDVQSSAEVVRFTHNSNGNVVYHKKNKQKKPIQFKSVILVDMR